MENVTLLNFGLILLMFLALFANLSTNQVRRRQLYAVYIALMIFFFGIYVIYTFPLGSIQSLVVPYNLFCSFGLIFPQIVSRIFIRQELDQPVIYLKKKKTPLAIAGIGLLLAYLPWMLLLAYREAPIEGQAIYDEFDLLMSLSFLLLFILLLLWVLIMLVDRAGFYENGFYQAGFLSDWSNFKSYSWPQGDLYADPAVQSLLKKDFLVDLILETKSTFPVKKVRVSISFEEKNAVEGLLSKRIGIEGTTRKQTLSKPV